MFKSSIIYTLPSLSRTIFSFIFLLLVPFFYNQLELHRIFAAIVTMQISESFSNAGIEAIITRRYAQRGFVSQKFFRLVSGLRILIGLIIYLILALGQYAFWGPHISFLLFIPILVFNSIYNTGFILKSIDFRRVWKNYILYVFSVLFIFSSFFIFRFSFLYVYVAICSLIPLIFMASIFESLESKSSNDDRLRDIFLELKSFLIINLFKIISGSGATYIISIIFIPEMLVYFFIVERVKSIVVSALAALSTQFNRYFLVKNLKVEKLLSFALWAILFGSGVGILQMLFYYLFAEIYLSREVAVALIWVYAYFSIYAFFCPNFILQYNIMPILNMENRLTTIFGLQAFLVLFFLFLSWLCDSFSVFIIGLILSEALVLIYNIKIFIDLRRI